MRVSSKELFSTLKNLDNFCVIISSTDPYK